MTAHYEDDTIRVLHGDCLDVLRERCLARSETCPCARFQPNDKDD